MGDKTEYITPEKSSLPFPDIGSDGGTSMEENAIVTSISKDVMGIDTSQSYQAITSDGGKLNSSCDNILCNDTQDNKMIRCGKCNTKCHYWCTHLPAYQLALFLTKTYRKKFICESCVDISEGIHNLDSVDLISTLDITRLRDELQSKCSVIKSMEVAQKTLNDLINDKNEVIESQNIIIEAFTDCPDPDLAAEM